MPNGVAMVALSLEAMATRFELVLYGADSVGLRAGGEQALDEIRRIETQLSVYRADSEVARINARAATAAVKVDPRLVRMLVQCAALSVQTDGAFDPTVGPLVRTWGFRRSSGRVPDVDELRAAQQSVGMSLLALDDDANTVRFLRPGMELDLGGFGKGYAIDRAMESLVENGVSSALLHGGTSSVYGLGRPPDADAWRVALSEPLGDGGARTVVPLEDAALSVSAAHGKSFEEDGQTFGHVIDPRSGMPVRSEPAAAVVGPSAAICEALSTALMVNGAGWLPSMRERFPDYTGYLALPNPPAPI